MPNPLMVLSCPTAPWDRPGWLRDRLARSDRRRSSTGKSDTSIFDLVSLGPFERPELVRRSVCRTHRAACRRPGPRRAARPLYWSRVVGAGGRTRGLRADWQRQLREARSGAALSKSVPTACSRRHVRIPERSDGSRLQLPVTWTRLFDALLTSACDVRPNSLSRRAMARQIQNIGLLVGCASAHHHGPWIAGANSSTASYGTGDPVRARRVRRWYFEVWNEPNCGASSTALAASTSSCTG